VQNLPNDRSEASRGCTCGGAARPGAVRRSDVDPSVWQRPDMRRSLAARDMSAVFRLMQRHGVSQRAIAAMTGQSQSEVSEIIAGRRRVVSYDLLLRIAIGLNVPRGWMGLALDAEAVEDRGGVS
jgi:predicted XRE-type DNA-binding protein